MGQAAFRGTKSWQDIAQKAEAAAMLQARMRGNFTREVTDYELVEFRAAAALQAVWRRHLACGLACRLRWEKQGKLKRTFSWSRHGHMHVHTHGHVTCYMYMYMHMHMHMYMCMHMHMCMCMHM